MNTAGLQMTFEGVGTDLRGPDVVKALGPPGLFNSPFGCRDARTGLTGMDGDAYGAGGEIYPLLSSDLCEVESIAWRAQQNRSLVKMSARRHRASGLRISPGLQFDSG